MPLFPPPPSQDKQALAKVSTHPSGGGKGVGAVSSPSLLGDRARSLPGPTAPSAASTVAASPATGTALAGSPLDDDGSDGKGRSPALSVASGGGGTSGGGGSASGGGTSGGESRQDSGSRGVEGGSPAW